MENKLWDHKKIQKIYNKSIPYFGFKPCPKL